MIHFPLGPRKYDPFLIKIFKHPYQTYPLNFILALLLIIILIILIWFQFHFIIILMLMDHQILH